MAALVVGFCTLCGVADGAVGYVHLGGSDAAGGASWTAAKRSVTAALAACRPGDEIWVAAGVYQERINLANEVALYGGFRGNETVRAQRNWIQNETILDGGAAGIVVRCQWAGATPATRLDGFTVRNGSGILGGGIACTATSPTLANNRIIGNVSAGPGGGICCDNGSNPWIVGNWILENVAAGDEADGGGIACLTGRKGNLGSSPFIIGNVIARNRAEENGGGIAANGIFVSEDGQVVVPSAPTILNNLIAENLATQPPLGDFSIGGGAISCLEDGMAKVIANNIIVGNSGLQAGGILLVGGARDHPRVINNTIVGNCGPGIRWIGVQDLQFVNNIVAFNTAGLTRWAELPGGPPTLRHNLVFGNLVDFDGVPDVRGTAGNLGLDPRLVSAWLGDHHLQPDSPCIDAGDPAYVEWDWTDMDDASRSVGARVDIGADEADGARRSGVARIVRVSPSGNDNGDGANWASAKRTVGAAIAALHNTALNTAPVIAGGEVWVQSGTYSETLILPPYVHLYGGFRGSEAVRDLRDPALHSTRLDAGGWGRVVLAIGGHRLNTIDGFTVTGGRLTTSLSDQGGGIECYQADTRVVNNRILSNVANVGGGLGAFGASPWVESCVISNNAAGGDGGGVGGGVHLDRSAATIRGCVIAGNAASDGGGVYTSFSKPQIVGCQIFGNRGKGLSLWNSAGLPWAGAEFLRVGENRIYENIASHEGAGIYVLYCAGRVENNLVGVNRAGTLDGGGTGGGMSLNCGGERDGDLVVAHNTVLANVAEYFGLNLGGGINVSLLKRPNLILANNIVAYNSSGIFNQRHSAVSPVLIRNLVFANNDQDYQLSGSFGLPGGPLVHPSDLNLDPRFVSLQGDFHLRSDSPGIDAGDPLYASAIDYEGRPRPLVGVGGGGVAARPDLGAYEGWAAGVPGRLQWESSAVSAFALDGKVLLRVRRTDGLGGAISVAYATRPGTARPGQEFQPASGRLTFLEGQSIAELGVSLIPASGGTGVRSFSVLLSDPSGGAVLGTSMEVQILVLPTAVVSTANPWNIPESWIREHGLTLSETSDVDGDGLLDRNEYLAGTNPRDPASALRLSASLASAGGRAIRLQWSSVAGKVYRVRRGAGLPSLAVPGAARANRADRNRVDPFLDRHTSGGGRVVLPCGNRTLTRHGSGSRCS
jgi:hypothetical protein